MDASERGHAGPRIVLSLCAGPTRVPRVPRGSHARLGDPGMCAGMRQQAGVSLSVAVSVLAQMGSGAGRGELDAEKDWLWHWWETCVEAGRGKTSTADCIGEIYSSSQTNSSSRILVHGILTRIIRVTMLENL